MGCLLCYNIFREIKYPHPAALSLFHVLSSISLDFPQSGAAPFALAGLGRAARTGRFVRGCCAVAADGLGHGRVVRA